MYFVRAPSMSPSTSASGYRVVTGRGMARLPRRCPLVAATAPGGRTQGGRAMSGTCSVSRLSLLLSVAASATVIPASGAAARGAVPGGTYVGTLAGTHAFVAVLIGERGALRAY